MLYSVLHVLLIKKESHLNRQGVGALALEEALGLAEGSCVGLAYAGDNMCYKRKNIRSSFEILAEVLLLQSWLYLKDVLHSFVFILGVTNSWVPARFIGLCSLFDTALESYHHLCIVAAQVLGWIKKTIMGNNSENL